MSWEYLERARAEQKMGKTNTPTDVPYVLVLPILRAHGWSVRIFAARAIPNTPTKSWLCHLLPLFMVANMIPNTWHETT